MYAFEYLIFPPVIIPLILLISTTDKEKTSTLIIHYVRFYVYERLMSLHVYEIRNLKKKKIKFIVPYIFYFILNACETVIK
jgi:hypothetical protein